MKDMKISGRCPTCDKPFPECRCHRPTLEEMQAGAKQAVKDMARMLSQPTAPTATPQEGGPTAHDRIMQACRKVRERMNKIPYDSPERAALYESGMSKIYGTKDWKPLHEAAMRLLDAPTAPPGTTGELKQHLDRCCDILGTLRSETRPIAGHEDPGAIEDCWREAFDELVMAEELLNSTPPTTPGEPTDGEIDLKRLHRIGQYVRSKNIICHEYPIETVPLDEREKKQVGELNALFHELFGAAQPAEDTRRLEEVRAILEAAPELNMANYSHEQVRELNDAVIEAVLLIRAAMEANK